MERMAIMGIMGSMEVTGVIKRRIEGWEFGGDGEEEYAGRKTGKERAGEKDGRGKDWVGVNGLE
jgi:hypothetical protein